MLNKYNITADQLDTIENMISYYHVHGVEKMIYKAPGFVNEDFTKLLSILEAITQQEA